MIRGHTASVLLLNFSLSCGVCIKFGNGNVFKFYMAALS